MRRSYAPRLRATYRVQLHAEFTLRDAIAIVPYLAELGVSHLYASPVFAARPGSRHGYDVTDPRRVNSELGDEADLVALADALHEKEMALLVDIVPNHMGIGPHNRYWEDVLANGERSQWAKWFDIAWDMHDDRKLVLPFLGADLDTVIEKGELRAAGGRIHHYDNSVPIAEGTECDDVRDLLSRQHYRLVDWRRGPREINYRRFFDVNDLVALRMEDEGVFRETHEYVLSLVGRGVIDGLRVDHIDGLRHPLEYLQRLRSETDDRRPGGVPIFVEKILMGDERLRTSWPVDGTTGYERLNDIEDLFVDPDGFARLESRYRSRRRSKDLTFAGTVRADKRAVLDRSFAADVARLSRLLTKIIHAGGETVSPAQVFHGIEEYIAASPVYRTYIEAGSPPSDADKKILDSMELVDAETIANRIRSLMLCHPEPLGCHPERSEGSAFPRGELREGSASPDDVAEFIERMQQLTGPATAKGLEDTAHYAYIPLVSRNEVGGAPDRPLDNVVGRFHEANTWFAEQFPHSLVTTSTHDTKRSGDVRARISALSEIDREWERAVARWRRLNRRHQKVVAGRIVPDSNAELLVYQTLVGIWPAPRPGRRADDVPERAWRTAAKERMEQYVLKAVREAKLRTSWTDPDETYERTLLDFVRAILDGPEDDPFLSDLSRLVARIAPIAQWNTLSRILLHFTMPGTPDIYQGDEAWNYTLVDPDNRRPVNYTARRSSLSAVQAMPSPATVSDMLGELKVKTWLTHRILATRRAHADLFADGAYEPLIVRGPAARNVVAFQRRLNDERAIVIAPRLISSVTDAEWKETSIQLEAPSDKLVCALTGEARRVNDGRIELQRIPLHLFA